VTDEDRPLVQRASAGDRCALTELIRQWNRPILSVAYRVLGDSHDALDVRQQAFQRIVARIGTFDPQGQFAPWVYRIVVNLCRDLQRARGQSSRALGELKTRAASGGPDPAAAVPGERTEVSAAVRDAILALPAEEREVIVLREYANLSFSQMARTLDVPASTLKSRALRGLRRLRTRLSHLECGMGQGRSDS
jgi:RNA polymerase sigma-70 factor (ECF subfamily)